MWNNYAQALLAADEEDEAEKALLRALALDPDLAVAHNNLGNVYSRTARPAKAAEQYRAALDKAPDNPAEVWANLADLFRQEGAYAQADSAIGVALAHDGGNGRYWALKGRIARSAGDAGEALRSFAESARRRPGHARVLAEWGEVLSETGDPPQALDRFAEALQVDPGYARAWYGLAEAALRTGDRRQARRAFAAFLERWPHRDRRYERATAFLSGQASEEAGQ